MSVYEAGACLIGEAPGLCLYRVYSSSLYCLSSLLLKYLLLNTHHGRSKGRRRRFPTGVDHPGGGSRQVHNATLEWRVSLVSIAQRDLPGAFSRFGGLCWTLSRKHAIGADVCRSQMLHPMASGERGGSSASIVPGG